VTLARLFAWVEDCAPGPLRLSLLAELPEGAKAALFDAGVLCHASPAASLPCAEHADCYREVRTVGARARVRLVALCTREPPECLALDVAPDDIAQASIDVAALARLLADLAHARGPEPRGAPHEILRLGRLDADPRCEAFFVARPERVPLVAFFSSRDRAGAPARLLVPTARRLPADVASRGEIVVLDGALTFEAGRFALRGVSPGPSLRVVRGGGREKGPAPAPMPAAARWMEVCFERIDGHTVLVRVGERTARRTFQDFGMMNEKTREPKKARLVFT
jgi:hypothetical protein